MSKPPNTLDKAMETESRSIAHLRKESEELINELHEWIAMIDDPLTGVLGNAGLLHLCCSAETCAGRLPPRSATPACKRYPKGAAPTTVQRLGQ